MVLVFDMRFLISCMRIEKLTKMLSVDWSGRWVN